MVHEVAGARFRAAELPAGRVAVAFVADWCGYCHRFLRHFRRLPEAWVVDVSDEDDPLWDGLPIRSVPTVIVFEDGVPHERWAGVLGEAHVAEVRSALSGSASSCAP